MFFVGTLFISAMCIGYLLITDNLFCRQYYRMWIITDIFISFLTLITIFQEMLQEEHNLVLLAKQIAFEIFKENQEHVWKYIEIASRGKKKKFQYVL